MSRRFLIISLMALGLAGFAVYRHIGAFPADAAAYETDEPAAQGIRKAAPAFHLKALDGAEYGLRGPREKPLVLNFWASWCGPCHEEAPDLKKLSERYQKDIDFYAVNITKGDTLKNARQFAQQYGFNMPVLLDMDGSVSGQYRVLFVPTSFLIDKKGIIREVVHVMPPDLWEKKLDLLLKG
ncbi:TlpA family protein disulfide reductase [Paenibacillus hamazuiensis]|uniref:TlpA family protein disulfide reductase n=1 Tax=Paenibacillus hamazuiensis TaxID=2936508 RepID=UPI00200BAB4F|nr:TlpA disulfide reductase family protein [Paenibacillus hamazuiensis]